MAWRQGGATLYHAVPGSRGSDGDGRVACHRRGGDSLRGRSAGRTALTLSWASAAWAQAGAGHRPVTRSRWSAGSHAPPPSRANWQEPRQELEELDEAEEKESPPATLDWQGATSYAARARAVNMTHSRTRRRFGLGSPNPPEADVKVKLRLRDGREVKDAWSC